MFTPIFGPHNMHNNQTHIIMHVSRVCEYERERERVLPAPQRVALPYGASNQSIFQIHTPLCRRQRLMAQFVRNERLMHDTHVLDACAHWHWHTHLAAAAAAAAATNTTRLAALKLRLRPRQTFCTFILGCPPTTPSPLSFLERPVARVRKTADSPLCTETREFRTPRSALYQLFM